MLDALYQPFIKPFLFQMDPEKAHYFAFDALKLTTSLPVISSLVKWNYEIPSEKLKTQFCGITFPSPVGLAAGFDKDAKLVDGLASLGFGFIEIGTVTPKPQDGNPKPRIFRLPEDNGLINRMGFNNEGVDAAVARLGKRHSKVIVGGNVGKNKLTPNEEAVGDYLYGLEKLAPVVDYFTINISSPNTPNLRALQDKEPLRFLLKSIKEKANELRLKQPILLKIAPDVNEPQLDDILEVIEETGVDGIIATNTTLSRDGLRTSAEKVEKMGAGGLSGKPVGKRSTEIIRLISQKTGQHLPIIGVGGIHSADDALEKLDAGATLVQLYTGFVYEGPGLIQDIYKALLKK